MTERNETRAGWLLAGTVPAARRVQIFAANDNEPDSWESIGEVVGRVVEKAAGHRTEGNVPGLRLGPEAGLRAGLERDGCTAREEESDAAVCAAERTIRLGKRRNPAELELLIPRVSRG